MPAIFTFPNRILFGDGARAELPAELARLGVKRPLVVTDPGLVASGLVAEVVAPARLPVGLRRRPGQPDRGRRPGRPGPSIATGAATA